MESDTRFSNARHVFGLLTELNAKPGLPFEEVLPVEEVAAAIAAVCPEYRDRFFLPL
jgi:hypothetical protein